VKRFVSFDGDHNSMRPSYWYETGMDFLISALFVEEPEKAARVRGEVAVRRSGSTPKSLSRPGDRRRSQYARTTESLSVARQQQRPREFVSAVSPRQEEDSLDRFFLSSDHSSCFYPLYAYMVRIVHMWHIYIWYIHV
jgi:hypothetical protein